VVEKKRARGFTPAKGGKRRRALSRGGLLEKWKSQVRRCWDSRGNDEII